MSTTCNSATLMQQDIVEVNHDVALWLVYKLLCRINSHGAWVLTVLRTTVTHGLTEELLEPLRISKDIGLFFVLTLVHFLCGSRRPLGCKLLCHRL